jgi:uncharacterized protein YaiE (UPF0345 family)
MRVTAGTEIFEILNTGSEVRLAVVSADPMTFRTSNVEAMRIDSSGNVGIGTSSPYVALEIQPTTAYTTAYAADLGANAANLGYGSSLTVWDPSNSATVSGLSLFTRSTGLSRWDILNVWTNTYTGDLVFRGRNGGTSTIEAMRIDSSGNVGIGGSPFNYGAGYVDLWIQASTTPVLDLAVGSTRTGTFFASSTDVTFGTVAAVPLIFNTANTERMRIDSSGKILFNTTTQNNNEQVGMVYSSNAGVGFSIKDSNAQSGNTFIEFRNGATLAGTITSNGTTTMTYGSASDYRLKENLSPLTGALATVEQLKPQVGSWKADGSKFVGFVAHELQEVFPDAVVGEKDRIDADGNPLYQMVDTGSASIIATLTAAIQEQQAMIDTMKQEIAELKAKVGE